MTAIEVQESYTDHDGGEFSAVNVRENLAIDPAGVIFVSLYSHNRVDRYDPATGAAAPFAALPAPPVGLAFDADGAVQEAKLLRLEVGRGGLARTRLSWSRRAVTRAMRGSRSTPTHSRPRDAATRPTVPAPANGSRTGPRFRLPSSTVRITGSGIASQMLSG